MVRIAFAGVALLLLAGCAQPAQQTQYSIDFNGYVDTARPDPTFGDVATGPAVAADLNATTAAPPRLVEGEWWRIRNTNPLMGETSEYVRVVANATAQGYIMGMPHEGWYKEAIVMHAPAFGDVARNLSYPVHNQVFEPLRFPLVAGATWTTMFAGAYKATVVSADRYTATVRLDAVADPQPQDVATGLIFPNVGNVTLVYDARQHEVVRMTMSLGEWDVIEHGYGFEGWVTVPRAEATVIDYSTLGPAAPGQPILKRAIKVDGGFNRLTMLQAIFAETPGVYHIASLPPEEKEMRTESDGSHAFTVRTFESNHPDGTWNQEDYAFGVGGTYSMGIAYHQFDIRLPDGLRRADHFHPVMR